MAADAAGGGPAMAEQNQRKTALSLCETCAFMREVVTPKESRFLLCRLSQSDPAFPKYPPQPVLRCDGQRPSANDHDGKRGGSG